MINIYDLMHPLQNCIAAQGCFFGHGQGLNGALSPNGTGMAASPVLSVPSEILTWDPVWASAGCHPDPCNWSFFDPARVLTPVAAMVPKITEALMRVVG